MYKLTTASEWVNLIYPDYPYTETQATAVDGIIQGN